MMVTFVLPFNLLYNFGIPDSWIKLNHKNLCGFDEFAPCGLLPRWPVCRSTYNNLEVIECPEFIREPVFFSGNYLLLPFEFSSSSSSYLTIANKTSKRKDKQCKHFLTFNILGKLVKLGHFSLLDWSPFKPIVYSTAACIN